MYITVTLIDVTSHPMFSTGCPTIVKIEIEMSEELLAQIANHEQEGELKTGEIKQIQAWTAHKDIIRSINYISMTDDPLVFTAGMDRMAYIWDLNKVCRGKLIQGYMLKKNYYWDFKLNNYTDKVQARIKA